VSCHAIRLVTKLGRMKLTFNPLTTESDSESELLYDWRFPANQFVLAPSSLRLPPEISQSQSQSYVTTDVQSASLSWCQAPMGLNTRCLLLSDSCRLVFVGPLSDERTSLSFARLTVSSSKSLVSMYNLHVIKCMYIVYSYVCMYKCMYQIHITSPLQRPTG
jgi:hypothetical protein